jgi:hypothetical protein
LRRASFDLTGLPPTPAEIVAFEADVGQRGDQAYLTAAQRLLNSPRFGERLAQDWLDVARYADTHGFNNDSARSMWRWRDWVIESFNHNAPFSQFITEQLAGDLLPNPTDAQRRPSTVTTSSTAKAASSTRNTASNTSPIVSVRRAPPCSA